jgi:hypothetical protein
VADETTDSCGTGPPGKRKGRRKRRPILPLATDPARSSSLAPTFPPMLWLPGWRVAMIAFVPVDRPRPKGNSKTIVRMGPRLVPLGDPQEEAQERDLRAVLRERAAGHEIGYLPDWWPWERVTWPHAGPALLDVCCDLPLPELSPEHDVAWRARALAGDPFAAPLKPGLPDAGNLLKLIEDACKGSLVVDDVQLLAGWRAKRWSTSPGWWLRLSVPVVPAPQGAAGRAPSSAPAGATIRRRPGRPTAQGGGLGF